MAVCGVIAEYDPFHRGHERHLRLARAQTGADQVVCVLSGSFTQRGLPALLPAHARAEMALRCGADIVLQLPYAFSVREAEGFALGGVGILTALGCVTHLSFGCEESTLPYLSDAAALLERPDDGLNAAIRRGLDGGKSYAAAAGSAVEKRLGLVPHALDAPNTALALSYLRAIRRLNSPLIPAPVPRTGDYHAAEIGPAPSASALRGAVLRGDWAGIRAGMPEEAFLVLERAALDGQLCPPQGMDALLRSALLSMTPEEIAALPGIGEGLEMRILDAARRGRTREEIIAFAKSRRYTHGRIARALCHAAVGASAGDLPALPAAARILGFRKSARPLLRQMQKSGFPLYTRPARESAAALDSRADEIWRIMAGLPLGDTYRRPPVMLP